METGANLEQQSGDWKAAHALTLRLGAQLDLGRLSESLCHAFAEYGGVARAAALVVADDRLVFAGWNGGGEPPGGRDAWTVVLDAETPPMSHWMRGESAIVESAPKPVSLALRELADAAGVDVFSLPLLLDQRLVGVVFLFDPQTGKLPGGRARALMRSVVPTASIALFNAQTHSRTVDELAAKMRELQILRRIDRDLSDTIELEPVFMLTLDWALRFTNAHYASISLYNQDEDALYGFVDYGYELPPEQLQLLRVSWGGGIAQRVARSGRPEVVPDVSLDHDYTTFSSSVHSHVSVPVMREDRVVGVISVESRRLNAFTDDHIEFVEKLATRAGVALDNARLYTETKREREKLSRILSGIADVVIVVGADERIALINQSALLALALEHGHDYVGAAFDEVFADSDFLKVFERARAHGGTSVEELKVADGRTFYVNLSRHTGIGWIIVMHDITPLKETDQLKTELVQTVSHDLKQPLGVMNGYVELLLMQGKLDPMGQNFANMILRSIQNMRQLIDDLLDLAKIESGVALEMSPTSIGTIIADSVAAVGLTASSRETQVINDLPADLPSVLGEPSRLTQIFTNLIGNAVKYSPPKSTVRIWAEAHENGLRIAVRDNGIGIAPEDQARIFDRFYRVRRQETRDIEGTGLGLAIVKKLIEAHGGHIGLESRLGEGSTFWVTLPLAG